MDIGKPASAGPTVNTSDRYIWIGSSMRSPNRNGGVGLGKISPKVPRSYLRRVERIRKEIVAGQITVPSTFGSR